MKFLNKILAFALVALFALSVSGLKFHFHFCGHENKLYTSVHLPDGKNHEISCECKTETKSCCQKAIISDKASDSHTDLCVDLEESVETDQEYQLSQFQMNLQLSEIELFVLPELYANKLETSSGFTHKIIPFHSPPDPIFTSSFLL